MLKVTKMKHERLINSIFFIIIPTAILIIFSLVFFFVYYNPQPLKKNTTSFTPTPTLSPDAVAVLDAIPSWLSDVNWSQPKQTTKTTPLGDMQGTIISGQTTTDSANITHFEDADALARLGFYPNNNLAADGPGSSMWGYSKEVNDTQQIILFSYTTEPTSSNPNEPLQFNCPCTTEVSVFISNPQKGQE